ncbi:FAD-dependent oxidoreductase [Chelativorans sp. YIM 93263]|uniref:FAD-dependent oxidoreductase n=1 Tax=Chelativorans sp. YIM 93263 TaxID=2906648 RepID=UPI002378CAD5|nr:FAD-binding protein [Chelativorans sp. YIM 93263]
MNRRDFLLASAAPLLGIAGTGAPLDALANSNPESRTRPGHPGWPSQADWAALKRRVGGRLLPVESPIANCAGRLGDDSCEKLFGNLRNPYFLGDEPGLTQTLGWVDAWTSQPSVYAVAAETTGDVVAAVDFAREHRLRIVVKGGGHSYQGTSNATDSLLIWTRHMDSVTLHDAFVGAGCDGQSQTAVSVGAGALWGQVYNAVTTTGGRYVQGGGCLTVGVAGLIQSGGFGSFSKAFGLAAGSLLEAEIVTSDGKVLVANRCTHPDLFWAIKGGGGGTFGVVTRMTIRTHPLPEFFGGVFATVEATSDEAFRQLVGRLVDFYGDALFNPHWGEQVRFRPRNVLDIGMVFQGMDQSQAEAAWRPFFDEIAASPHDFRIASDPLIIALPARRFWDPAFLKQIPGLVLADMREGVSQDNIFWAGNLEEAGQVLYGYQSAWLPAALLEPRRRGELADALYAASRRWSVALHFNKGLAGAPDGALEAAAATAINPAAIDAFALLISAAEGPPAYPGIPGREPNRESARKASDRIEGAMVEMRRLLSKPASYVAESNFFEESWQEAFWGSNYADLLEVKHRYDPEGLFIVHHGVGSERWSLDGFTRRSGQ